MSGIRRAALLLLVPLILPLTGCVEDMWNGSRVKPLSTSPIFADGRSSRPLEPDTVAQGALANDYLRPKMTANGGGSNTLPFPLTQAVLDRGELRYNACCVECHGFTGYGDGIVVERGFPAPPSYHTARLRNAPLSHFYDVITNGYGVMYPHNDRVEPRDRWAIAAYIRALQLSQNARATDVPADQQTKLSLAPILAEPQQTPIDNGLPKQALPGDLLNGQTRQ